MLTSPFYDSSSFSDWFGLVIEQPRKSCLFLGLHQKLCSLRLYYRSSLNTHQTCKATILSPPQFRPLNKPFWSQAIPSPSHAAMGHAARNAWRQSKTFRDSMTSTTSTTSLHSIEEENEDNCARSDASLDSEDGECGCSSGESDNEEEAGSPLRSPRSLSPVRSPCSVSEHSFRRHGYTREASAVASLAAVVKADADRGDEAACDIVKKTLLDQLDAGGGLDAFLALMQPFTDSADDEPLPPIDDMKNSPPRSPRVSPTVCRAGAKLSSPYEYHQEPVLPSPSSCASPDGQPCEEKGAQLATICVLQEDGGPADDTAGGRTPPVRSHADMGPQAHGPARAAERPRAQPRGASIEVASAQALRIADVLTGGGP